jgi:hypothetical protein
MITDDRKEESLLATGLKQYIRLTMAKYIFIYSQFNLEKWC